MRLFEKKKDHLTGLVTSIGSEDDKMVIRYDQDVEGALDYTSRLRNAPEYAKQGIKNNMMHGAHIPDVVILKMKMEDGFDCYKASAKEIRQFLNRNKDKYGYLFTKAGQI